MRIILNSSLVGGDFGPFAMKRDQEDRYMIYIHLEYLALSCEKKSSLGESGRRIDD